VKRWGKSPPQEEVTPPGTVTPIRRKAKEGHGVPRPNLARVGRLRLKGNLKPQRNNRPEGASLRTEPGLPGPLYPT